MKKQGLLILAVLMLFLLAACSKQAINTPSLTPEISDGISSTADLQTEPQTQAQGGNKVTTGESKVLVAYFSSSGNIVTDEEARGNVGKGITKTVAEFIQGQVGGDLFFIETVDKYPSNYNDTIDVAMQELRNNTRPALASHVENMDEYDVIFLGYPIWWQALPRAVLTFIEEYDFSGKTVIPFCTYEDSGVGRSIGELESALPNATFLEEFGVRSSGASNAGGDITQWIAELDLEN